MSLANILSGQASFSPLANIAGLQPADVAPLATIIWQWLVFSALIAWIGVLIAGYKLLTAFRGRQQPEITAVLYIAAQRQRRQSWLWLSIVLVGIAALFWLRVSQAQPQQLDLPPNWPALWLFMTHTSEGWLWFARAGLALLACGLLTAFSLAARRRARSEQEPDLLIRGSRVRSLMYRRGSARSMASGIPLLSGWRHQGNFSATQLTTQSNTLEQRLLSERRKMRLSLVISIALLCTFLLPLPTEAGAPLPLTALALRGVALLSLAAWFGGLLYLPSVLTPATSIIESAERTQTLVEVLPAIKPPIIPALMAIALYSLFSLEARLTSPQSFPRLLSTPYGWLFIAALSLLGIALLLTVYQARWALPLLAQAAWFAARGTVMSVLGGVDVSRSLQMSQRERQALANRAERRLMRVAYAQVMLGMLVILCLVLVAFVARPLAS